MSGELRPSPRQTRKLRGEILVDMERSLAEARRLLGDREYRELVVLALERATVGAQRLNAMMKGLQK